MSKNNNGLTGTVYENPDRAIELANYIGPTLISNYSRFIADAELLRDLLNIPSEDALDDDLKKYKQLAECLISNCINDVSKILSVEELNQC